ncbi:MAG TPA: S24 family peptidase [Thermoanaerobaculia bacterium]|nr:S24 family peptidase [Thermoanaerobaculia bacterium]
MHGRRIRRILDERKIKHYLVAADLKISKSQLNRIFSDEIDMRVGQLEYFSHLLKLPVWTLLGDKDGQALALYQRVQHFMRDVSSIVGPAPVAEETGNARLVPLLRVAATPDNETYDDDPELREYEVPREYYRPQVASFEVVGDSMSGDRIVSGDIVFTRTPRDEVDADGEIVVCRVDGYRHLKRLLYRRRMIHLVSSAPKRRDWTFAPDDHDFEVLGIVVGFTARIAR